MNKTIKLSLIFALLFSCATHHKQAQAGVVKEVVGTAITLTIIYYLASAIADSSNPNDTPDVSNFKKGIKKGITAIDDVALAANNSIEKHFGLDINKYRKKVVGVGVDTAIAILEKIIELSNTEETKNEAFKLKLGLRKKQAENGDPVNGFFGALKDIICKKKAKIAEIENQE